MDGGMAPLPHSFLSLHLDTRVSMSCILQSPSKLHLQGFLQEGSDSFWGGESKAEIKFQSLFPMPHCLQFSLPCLDTSL